MTEHLENTDKLMEEIKSLPSTATQDNYCEQLDTDFLDYTVQ